MGDGKGAMDAVELICGDVTGQAAVLRALDGAAIVYHLAGCARAWVRDRREFQAVNGGGTEKICRAAQEHRIALLVHVSTNLVDAEHSADRAPVASCWVSRTGSVPRRQTCFQTGLAMLVHFGKPGVELAAAFPARLLFGWVTLRTGSIW